MRNGRIHSVPFCKSQSLAILLESGGNLDAAHKMQRVKGLQALMSHQQPRRSAYDKIHNATSVQFI